ncbi:MULTISPECIES: phosphatase PAP2 family protein [Sorangium]|uniref:Phosphatase PAP2 family protein n=1 Tax=Sorangium atrum TaxID=2995308 RepID=A0ABT5C8S7_9BACT|nr:phosphatase PAP2 family protein [Sorangium aterium]MDC0682839.1 phosphatase PAP2 family protein [Sorangium aterium]
MRYAALLACVCALAWSAPAAAQTGPAAPDWAFGTPGGEVALAAACTASLAAYLLPQRRSGWGAASSEERNDAIGLASDITGAAAGTLLLLGSGYALEGSYLGGAGVPRPYARALRTSLIEVEAAALSTGLSNVIKRLAGRCRPRSWRTDRCGETDLDFDAFPSGHTTPVAAIAGARLNLALRTTGDAAPRLGALALAEAATVVTMALRIGAGAHSWQDVGAGMILGHVTGFAIAAVHPIQPTKARYAAGVMPGPPPEPAAVTWSWAF